MKKVVLIAFSLLVCFLFVACDKGITPSANIPIDTQSSTPEITQAVPSTSIQPAASPAENINSSLYSFAHTAEVYANPDAFKGKTYASLFQISSKQAFEGKTVYLAFGYQKGGSTKTYTILDFKDGVLPTLATSDVVYARGIIEGKGSLYNDAGESINMLWLDVTDLETDASKASIVTQSKDYTFGDGKYTAKSGSLSIEILSLKFTGDALMLSTKTADSSVKSQTTYYFLIIAHQDGHFAYYDGLDFWISPNGMAGYDNVPLPKMDSTKDLTFEFVPYSKDNTLLYDPLVIDVNLSK